MEVRGEIQKDKLGKVFVIVSLTEDDINIIHEALAKTVQDTKHPEESNIQKMIMIRAEFLKLRDKARPS